MVFLYWDHFHPDNISITRKSMRAATAYETHPGDMLLFQNFMFHIIRISEEKVSLTSTVPSRLQAQEVF